MLRELSVQNLALIEDVRIDLRAGYCAWTGETGAGKSLLLTALSLVLGGKASADLVRSGCDEARAAAVFEIPEPETRARVEAILGGPLEDETLIVTRRVSAQGRGSAHANGLPVPVSTLRSLGEILVDIHGQNEGRALLDPDRQRAWLDAHAGLGPRADRFRKLRQAHADLRRQRLDLLRAADDRRRERALVAFERDELHAFCPEPDEFDEQTRLAHRLGSVGRLRDAAQRGYRLLYEAEPSAQGLLEEVARLLEPLGDAAPELADAAGELERLAESTREIAYALRRLGRDFDEDPTRLEEIETRLATYRRLAARFGCKPDELAARHASAQARLDAIDREEANLEALDAPLSAAWAELRQAAAELSTARRKAAGAFAKAVQSRLKTLHMPEARVSVEVTTDPMPDDPTETPPPEWGPDRVEFLFAPNLGEEPKPLRKIASGGELSRVTLAIKATLAGVDRVPTLVFDEIDTGVGGRLGSALGRTLADLSHHHQIICVTHLPQMASFAGHQWAIRKVVEKGRTRTTIEPLDETERVEELAQMLRGESAAEGTRQEARAMLVEARAGA
ncbi:DNA repair protein RecN [Isosphaeraceae bacterium EP7]